MAILFFGFGCLTSDTSNSPDIHEAKVSTNQPAGHSKNTLLTWSYSDRIVPYTINNYNFDSVIFYDKFTDESYEFKNGKCTKLDKSTLKWSDCACPKDDRPFSRIAFKFKEIKDSKSSYQDSITVTFEQPKTCCTSEETFEYNGKKACVVSATDIYFNIQLTDDISVRVSTNSRKGESFSKSAADSLLFS